MDIDIDSNNIEQDLHCSDSSDSDSDNIENTETNVSSASVFPKSSSTRGQALYKSKDGTLDILAFYGSFLSNFHPARFSYKGIHWLNSEQAYQYEKACFFDDRIIANLILEAKFPSVHKIFGRAVRGDVAGSEWQEASKYYMKSIVKAKFCQNDDLLRKLLATGNTMLVEASKTDRIWGTGFPLTCENNRDPELYRDGNWLGKILMEVRSEIQAGSKQSETDVCAVVQKESSLEDNVCK